MEVHLLEQDLVIERVLFGNVRTNRLLDPLLSLLLPLMVLAHLDERVYVVPIAIVRIDHCVMRRAEQDQVFVAVELVPRVVGIVAWTPRLSRTDVGFLADDGRRRLSRARVDLTDGERLPTAGECAHVAAARPEHLASLSTDGHDSPEDLSGVHLTAPGNLSVPAVARRRTGRHRRRRWQW